MIVSGDSGARPPAHELRPGARRGAPDGAARELAALAPYVPAWLQARAWHDLGGLRPGAGGREQIAVVYVALAGLATLVEWLIADPENAPLWTALLDGVFAVLIAVAEQAGGHVA